MAFKQIKQFNPAKMGTRQGWCLQNVAKGFGAYPSNSPSSSAKSDMERNKKAGTFHAGNPPASIAVPVYCDTASIYEHIVVSDHGVVYSDGKVVRNGLKAYKVYGWGEQCNGFRIIEVTAEPSTGFLPPRGWWRRGDSDPRIGEMDLFLYGTFPAYAKDQAELNTLLGNYFGATTEKFVREFQRRTGLVADGCVGSKTYAKMQAYGFKG